MVFYVSYQRPCGIVSDDYINYLENNQVITCPWGHNLKDMIKIVNKEYTPEARNQDKNFVDNLSIGDYIIIPLPNREFLLKRVISNELKFIESDLVMVTPNQQTRSIKIYTNNNYNNSYYQGNNNYNKTNMIIGYKRCVNLGRFQHNYQINKFGQLSFARLRNNDTINDVRRICNIH